MELTNFDHRFQLFAFGISFALTLNNSHLNRLTIGTDSSLHMIYFGCKSLFVQNSIIALYDKAMQHFRENYNYKYLEYLIHKSVSNEYKYVQVGSCEAADCGLSCLPACETHKSSQSSFSHMSHSVAFRGS